MWNNIELLGELFSDDCVSCCKMQFMLLVNVILIVLGALMDSISATLVFAPILAPVAIQHYGIDPIHFGILTPPVSPAIITPARRDNQSPLAISN